MNVHTTVTSVERRILEVTRLIENEEYENALDALRPIKRNLSRIRTAIRTDTFQVFDHAVNTLKNLCEEKLNNNEPNMNAYSASRAPSGGRGRPKVNINRNQIELFLKENYTAKQMARHFDCSTKLIYSKCYSFGIKLRNKYYNRDDHALHAEILKIHNEFPNSGVQMMLGYLRAKGITVQRQRVRSILVEIDPLGTARRWSSTIHRRSYQVPTPNSLWHIDANLKLIRWHFAVHGCIDGYSRLILYVHCATSMTASTVLPLFASAVVEYGLPSRVRSDMGYENLFIAMIMNAIRGLNRGSHIAGRSVHNQRIERLWVDVYTQVLDIFHKEFYCLEENGQLDINDDRHMYALQRVYVEHINRNLEQFRIAWNSHILRTERKTPSQLWLSGMLQNINSSYTAPNEIFVEQEDLHTRLLAGFAAEDLNEVIIAPEENVSNLTVNLNLNEAFLNEIQQILNTNVDSKSKYLQIIELLYT